MRRRDCSGRECSGLHGEVCITEPVLVRSIRTKHAFILQLFLSRGRQGEMDPVLPPRVDILACAAQEHGTGSTDQQSRATGGPSSY